MDLLPLPPKTQALSSVSFRPPPLDGSLTITEMLAWQAKNSPNHDFIVYTRDDGTKGSVKFTDIVDAMYRGSRIIRERVNWQGKPKPYIIGILSSSEIISYFSTVMGIVHTGCSVVIISPRNSPLAIANLIKDSKAEHLLISQEPSVVELAKNSLQILSNDWNLTISTSSMLTYPDLFPEARLPCEDITDIKRDLHDVAIVIHSSGSTSFPKLIPWTNRRIVELATALWYGERDVCGHIFSCHPLPGFHGLGLMPFLWGITSGNVTAVYAPSVPPRVPTPDSVLEHAKADDCDFLFTVPAFIELYSREPETVKWLSELNGVLYGGGPLSQTTGDCLMSKGVTLFMGYGTSEAGVISLMYPKRPVHWQYFQVSSQQDYVMVPQGDGTFELVVLSCDRNRPSIVNTQVDGRDAYATADLFVPHPEAGGHWRIYGRADDQIMHSTGEKTNPGPLEHLIGQDPYIASAVIFGRGRFNAGVIIDLKPEFKFNPENLSDLAQWRNTVWPSIEKVNAYAPQHSRLFKEMIAFSRPSNPFSYTAKNTPRRHAIIQDYTQEINDLYHAAEASSQTGISMAFKPDHEGISGLVRQAVHRIMEKTVLKDSENLFDNGCDSLQATYIRNTILRALRDNTTFNIRMISENFVYDHPTISSLAAYIAQLVAAGDGESIVELDKSQRIQAMKRMVEKYSKNFPTHSGEEPNPDGIVVLLTGSTGGYGCHLLAKFLEVEGIKKVYALNRAGSDSIRTRQSASFADFGLDSAMARSPKLILLEADLANKNFDLQPVLFEMMHREVTHIVHNAWPVHFNIPFSSFESSVESLRALVDFALTSPLSVPPKFLFTSSIGVIWNNNESTPEMQVSADIARSSGYVESKWVSEQVLFAASSSTPLESTVVRVGQLCGGLNGSWNVKEWFPSLIQASQVLGCLPTDDRLVDWIPSQAAAAAMADFLFQPGKQFRILHLVHPRPVRWSSLACRIADQLSLELVAYPVWFKKLDSIALESDIEDLPALKLLPTYRSFLNEGSDNANAFGGCSVQMDNAMACSQTLRDSDFRQLGEVNVDAWLRYWRQKGVLR